MNVALEYCYDELKGLKGQKLSWATCDRFAYCVRTISEAARPSLFKDTLLEKLSSQLEDYRAILIRREEDHWDDQMKKAGYLSLIPVYEAEDDANPMGYSIAFRKVPHGEEDLSV